MRTRLYITRTKICGEFPCLSFDGVDEQDPGELPLQPAGLSPPSPAPDSPCSRHNSCHLTSARASPSLPGKVLQTSRSPNVHRINKVLAHQEFGIELLHTPVNAKLGLHQISLV